jgi:transcriptional regulator with XRE-family HTH domain
MTPASDDDMSAEDRLGIDLARSENHLIRQLIEARKCRNIKPAELARRMDVGRSVVTRFEAGGTNPTMATINRYAEAVGVVIRYSVSEPGDAPPGGSWGAVVHVSFSAAEANQIDAATAELFRNLGASASPLATTWGRPEFTAESAPPLCVDMLR